MILTAIAVFAAMSSPVDDFFPMVPGTKWTYEDGNGLESVDKVGTPVDIGKGAMATPIESDSSGESSGSLLYRIVGDTLMLVGYISKSTNPPLTVMDQPRPVMKVDSGKANWQYVGDLPTSLGPVSMHQEGETTHVGKRKILDREVDAIKVHVTSKIGDGTQVVQIVDDAVYGKGIGLIEMMTTRKANGQSVKVMKKLVKFEPPQGSTP